MTTFGAYLKEEKLGQNRGICQICGREQAVRDKGNITHHGYTIKFGWFQGTCPGQQHKPLQFDKSETEIQIKNIEMELPKIAKTIENLKSGKIFPKMVRKSAMYSDRDVMVPWAEGDERMKARELSTAIFQEERRYKAGVDTIAMLKRLIEEYFGKDLKVIPKAPPKKQIEVGSVINVAGEKNVVVVEIKNMRAQGVGPSLNGQLLDHVIWEVDGKRRAYPKRLAKLSAP